MHQLAPSGLLHGEVEDRQEDVDDLVGDEHPPSTGAAMGRMTSAPTPVAHSMGAIERIARLR